MIDLIENIICIILIIYMLIRTAFPNIFFKYKHVIGNVSFYTNTQNDNFLETVKKIDCESKNLEVYNPTKHIEIFFCDSAILYLLFAHFCCKTSGVNTTLLNYSIIFIANANFSKLPSSDNAIISVTVHEICHSYVSYFCTPASFIRYPRWKEEGICEYYSNKTFSQPNKVEAFIGNRKEKSMSYRYYTYRLAVTYLIRCKRYSYQRILADKISYKKLLKEVRAYLIKNGKNSIIPNNLNFFA